MFGADVYQGLVDTNQCRELTFCGYYEIALPECRGTWIEDAPPHDLVMAGWNWLLEVAVPVEEVTIEDEGPETWLMLTYV